MWNSFDSIFAGQTDEDGKPNGLVRAITKAGRIYEGIIHDNTPNGFARQVYSGGTGFMGYFESGYLVGNGIAGDKDGSITAQGWYESSACQGDYKYKDEQYKFFTIEDVVINKSF